jgi:hypothetical protein
VDHAVGEAAVFRIERGQVSEEELAAVAVTLLSLIAGCAQDGDGDGGDGCAVSWRRGGPAGVYRAPLSWR